MSANRSPDALTMEASPKCEAERPERGHPTESASPAAQTTWLSVQEHSGMLQHSLVTQPNLFLNNLWAGELLWLQ